MTRLPERSLDLLRAVAVLLVLLDHVLSYHGWSLPVVSNPELGRAGVLIFFVHTSLVLMSSLERGGFAHGWVRRFYVRRAFRIYPLAVVTVIGAVAMSLVGAPTSMPPLSTRVVLVNLTLTQNLFGVEPVVGMLWTLPLELQMYALLPFCFLAARKSPLNVVGLIALSVAASYVVSRVPQLAALSLAYFAPVFLLGVLAYSALRRWPQRWDLGESALTRVAHTIAKYSYGVYLLHVPALWVAFRFIHAAGVIQWTTFAVLIFTLPWLGYKLIELPMIKTGAAIVHRPALARSEPAVP